MEAYKLSGVVEKAVEAGLHLLADLESAERYSEALELALRLWRAFPDQHARLPDLEVSRQKADLAAYYDRALAALEGGHVRRR